MPLLSVLWGLALLSLVTVSLLNTSGTSYSLAQNALYAAQLDAVAEAALVRAAVAEADVRPELKWPADGTPQRFEFNGLSAIVRVQDELGRIDLNFADAPLLVGLFRSVGVDGDRASHLAENILDWRAAAGSLPVGTISNASAETQLGGQTPRHGPFQSVAELRLLPGMTPQLFRRVLPAVTVYSQHKAFDPQLAPKEVLLALPGATIDQVTKTFSDRAAAAQVGDGAVLQRSLTGHAFSVKIELAGPSGPRTYTAGFRLVDGPNKLYWLLHWDDRLEESL